jgi:hypothetical protein
MSDRASTRPRSKWITVAASASGILILAFAWLNFLGSAANMSADPGNTGSVAFLWSVVLVEAAALVGCVTLFLPTRTRRTSVRLLLWVVWLSVVVDIVLFAVAGYY